MDKNIKKLISEAFDELYKEFIAEAVIKKANTILDSEIEDVIKKATTTGRGLSYNDTANESSQKNFNIIIDYLIDDYKNTESPTRENSKSAIQSAFYPIKGNKIYRLAGKKFITDPNLEDAAMDAYEQLFINKFGTDEGLIKSYKGGGGFSALVINSMANLILSYITKGYGSGSSTSDALGGGRYGSYGSSKSIDDEYGNGKFGDKFASQEFSSEDGTIANGKEILNSIMTWLENHVGSSEFPVNEKQYIAFKGIINGDSPEQIFDENPGVFGKSKDVNIYFDRFITSKPAQEISDLISTIYDIDFNLGNLNKFGLKQTSSQKPEWNSFSKVDEKFTEEMKNIQDEMFGSLKSLGYEPTSFNSDKKIKSIINDLSSKGMDSEASVIESLFDDLEKAKVSARSKGLYGTNTSYLPQSEKEEDTFSDEFHGMFEGLDYIKAEKLIERVVRRVSLKIK